MKQRILEDLKCAMKNQDKELLSVVRMVKGAIQMEEIKVKHDLTDEEVVTIIAREIKTRKESIKEFEKGNRVDLINQTNKEIDILSRYMPEQMSEEEIDKVILEVFASVKPEKPSDMGAIMKAITPLVKGKADMSLVSTKIKERLSNL